ncbi:MAG: peptidoglycan-binding protein [Christensenellaceae bacterium]|jgi:hypothetical protein|nr:peptidoglycan-binding protein [Christensenellaceae bacterium]
MKRVCVCAICIALLFACPLAQADGPSPEPIPIPIPTPTPLPTYTPAPPTATPFSGLIGLNGTQGDTTNEDVVRVQIRLRELGYFNFKPTGLFQVMTANAAKAFQSKHTDEAGLPMIADGTIGPQSMKALFRHDVTRADITANIPIGKPLEGEPTLTGSLTSWSEVKPLFAEGASYVITDYNTGTTFSMAFVGGENHAEMECKTAADAGIYRQVFGGEYNYSKRPVVITIDGRNIAGSLSGWPHGEDFYPNNDMRGHTCLFFEGSLSHVGDLPDVEHLELVYRAAGRT